MGKMLEVGENVQSLAVIVLDVFLYNFWRRNDINKLFFARPTVKFSYILDDFKGQLLPLKSSKVYKNLTVWQATTHFSLEKNSLLISSLLQKL